MIFSGDRDDDIIEGIEKVNLSWGGTFLIEYEKEWNKILKRWKKRGACIVLATMYGINLPDVSERLRIEHKSRDLLLVVGSEKMPSEVFHGSDLNIAVANQPHSEVAAITLILDRIFSGDELKSKFEDSRLRIVPTDKGKVVEEV